MSEHILSLSYGKDSKSKIVISGYDNELYNEMLAGWNTNQKRTTAQKGLHRTEKIWTNFDFPLFLRMEE